MEKMTIKRMLPGLAPLLALIAYGVATFPTLVVTARRWTQLDESYSHGFLLLAISIGLSVLAWRRERPLPGFYPWWLVPFLGAVALYGLGTVLMFQAAQQLALVPLLLSLLAVLWGWRQIKPFLVPVGVLFMAMPVWDYLSWPLQVVTTGFSQFFLGFLNIDFEVEGVFVYLTGVGAFEVAHGCSGLRYLLVGTTLALLYGELNYRRLDHRLVLLAVTVFLSLLSNWVRVLVIIYMGYITDMETGLIEDHDSFGWWLFAGMLVPVFLFARWLDRNESGPVDRDRSASPGRPLQFGGTVTVVVLLSLMAVLVHARESDADGETQRLTLSPLPSSHWSPMFERNLDGWAPRVRHPDWRYQGTFFRSADVVPGERPDVRAFLGLYTYDPQRPGREVVQYGNRLYDSSDWLLEERFEVPSPGEGRLRGLELRVRGGEERLYLAFGYYVEGFWETDELRGKLTQLRGMFNARNDGSIFAYGVRCGQCDGEAMLAEVVREGHPVLQEWVDQRAQ